MSYVESLTAHYAAIRKRLYSPPVPAAAKIPEIEPAAVEPEPTLAEAIVTDAVMAEPADVWGDGSDEIVERRIPLGAIVMAACIWLGVNRVDFLSQRRRADYCRARHAAAYLARELTTWSLPIIGKHFGGRDHTTILASVRAIEVKLAAGDAKLADDLAMIRFLALAAA